ncbi:hypothetical protein EVAR_85729_1 [Eumeta japonica]|uniref:Uncharacterized protein n=1 Tax=Eumeta variegata TaxID=151549 RepID=A0A4C1Y132_EUMVA|nr:hypothetical protein EVAR_85729_1 [Eumeta japonica]
MSLLTTVAHGRSQLQRCNYCIADLLGRNRISNEDVIESWNYHSLEEAISPLCPIFYSIRVWCLTKICRAGRFSCRRQVGRDMAPPQIFDFPKFAG